MTRNLIPAIVVLLFLTIPLSATIVHIPDDYPTIQQGIDATSDGDTVLVQPGTYVENINFNGHNIVLGSMFIMTGDTTFIPNTIIDGDSSGSVVTFESGEDSTAVICGFTVQNGHTYIGGGIFCDNSSPSITYNLITANTADSAESRGNGGGIYCSNSNSVISNNVIDDNVARGLAGGIYCLDSDLFVADNIIANNISYVHGGGINLLSSDVTVTGNIISGNSGQVGAINCLNSHLILSGNTIQYNEALGPWHVTGGVACRVSESTIENNEFIGNDLYGLICDSSTTTVTDNLFSGNTFSALACVGQSHVDIINNVFTANIGYSGCGVYCSGSSPLIMANIFAENVGGDVVPSAGGGICCSNANPLITDNRFLANSVDYGGAIYCREGSYPRIQNNVFYGNIADSAGGVIFCESGDSLDFFNNCTVNNYSPSGIVASCSWSSHLNIANSIVKEDSLSDQLSLYDLNSSSTVVVTYSNIQGGWEGEGNIDVDPLFRDPENGNFHLMSTACGYPYDSPCIDAGDPALIDSLLDCSWGLGELRSDMGAYGGGDSVTVGIDNDDGRIPDQFLVFQNYPNPFNASTTIGFHLPEQSHILVEVYNLLGQRVATLFDGVKQAGYHQITWQADNCASAVYFARLNSNSGTKNMRMLLIK